MGDGDDVGGGVDVGGVAAGVVGGCVAAVGVLEGGVVVGRVEGAAGVFEEGDVGVGKVEGEAAGA